MVVGPCFAMRPRKIRERYLFFRDEWPFQDERILINHHIFIYFLFDSPAAFHHKGLMLEEAQVVLEMSAASRPFEHHQDVCIYLKKRQKQRKMIKQRQLWSFLFQKL